MAIQSLPVAGADERQRASIAVISPLNADEKSDVRISGTYETGSYVQVSAAMEAHAALQEDRNTVAVLVGANIAARRHRAGLTQQRLATQLGKERHRLAEWENGYHLPRQATLEKIALLLDCKWTDFYDEP